jgi:AmpD protein
VIFPGLRFVPSPNHSDREGQEVECVVIHHISLPPGEFGGPYVERFFTNTLAPEAHPYFQEIAELKVSAHFFIARDGEITQFVDTGRAAWHAGVSSWQGRDGVNRFSVGIELEGDEVTPYMDAQYKALKRLLRMIRAAHPAVAADSVVGHEDIAPGRKRDPGPMFDWERVRRF